MFDTQVTVVGNLVAEPRLASTNDGQAVASFRLASTPRRFDRATGEWKDGDTLFTNVTCWRALAENVFASLKKGSSVIVLGRLSVRPYETKDGDKRQSVDIDAIAVGPELGRAITLIKRAERAVPPSVEAQFAAPSADDLVPSVEASDGDDGDDGEVTAASATAWGVSLGQPFGDSLGGFVARDVPQMDEDGTGPVIDPMTAAMDPAETAETVEPEPVAQLASTGGRWRSRSAG
jgi:single-strand DNA-binding protein